MSATSASHRYLRFALSDRVQHLLLMLSFSLLGLTGLPQKYADAGWAVAIIRALGGIEQTRLIHHTSAVVMILVSIYHMVHLGYKVYVQRVSLSMLPNLQDLGDFLDAVKYNLGLSHKHPRYDRYNFIEKLEYWAVVWGTVLMTLTGFVLWNPVLISRFLPGEVIPAAKLAHGLEALLAVLAIVTWHFYFVHFAKFNKSIFTGYLAKDSMEEEHILELERRLQGQVRPAPAPDVRWRRLRLYLPLATVFVLVSVLGTWRFLTAESTAITTVPRIAAEDKVYQPVPLPRLKTLADRPTPDAPARVLPLVETGPMPIVSHQVDDSMAQCLLCHDPQSLIAPAPLDHQGRAESDCLSCHRAEGGDQ